ncbi:MAG: GTPase Era [Ignavibacteriales bacterium]|nr:GTPase Era [Ignavibacteriales bacterium]
MTTDNPTRSGYVAVIGLPNVGKSSTLNAALGQKISIVTAKPQTTRKNVLGIRTDEDSQIVFLDTAGLLAPKYLLQERMMREALEATANADLLAVVFDLVEDPTGEKTLGDERVSAVLATDRPALAIVNKIDRSNQPALEALGERIAKTDRFYAVVPISAKLGANVESLVAAIKERLPEGPKFFPDDEIAQESERFFVGEIVREKIFELYAEEVPYSAEAVVEDFREEANGKDFVSVKIFVERDSQRRILIGKKGEAIKRLGKAAREEAERFLGREIYLDLRVKAVGKWRSDKKRLSRFGYRDDEDPSDAE